MAEETTSTSKPHALLVPSPGLGHLIPIMELADCLVTDHNFQATVLVVSSNIRAQSQVIQSARTQKPFEIIELPPLEASSGHDANPAGAVFTNLPAIMLDARDALRSAISALEPKPAAMIVDLFGTPALTVADEFHMLKYVKVVSTAWPLTLLLYAPVLDKKVEGEYLDRTEPLQIPGCKPVRPEDVVKPMINRKSREYECFLRAGVEMATMSDGIFANTWEELEPVTLKAMREDPEWKQVLKVPVYAIGPMVRVGGQESAGPRSELLGWLDVQPKNSVLYIALGSGGVLSAEQITEMAWGLEFSAQRFIWVVHPPRDGDKGNDISDYLHEGFVARTQDKGVVVTTWAPQSEILAHPSVGGFLSHCGWSSALESILNLKPMIAWPLFAEQKMLGTQQVEELKVSIRPKVLPTKAIVRREEVEELVRKIMDQEAGDAMRARANEIKESGEAALREGGSTFKTMSELAKLCKINTQRQSQKVSFESLA
ncbi:putative anthocyanidin 3-O-glucosyltransferase [Rosa chinensis]|uniref:Glycosyltransferase n=1 Tax=Rosa chinensis TaxID=74649 RepID=A0A2P6RMK9_ROSCH|nr:anthocyanidin 3-O-glucosyltransferase 5 [Rosa chinensis]XP_040370646.1 anthocyanidin 3-O-glucosyltransferase 5 [Rosa chinensis]XP_040370647.1 anthocyanidin 3-O-glucosyltransferase 5 [Rosa chinensis]XP_040370648.1 anthocyanidin 3-O-glucosyltransferase 5 [Rosa chinensis]XP_040370649.1 anthocyanidin 3-O-glucosyltransferase 5 [Rosa chinensis]XP_040370651.1 anthocyanidin 3-O-glucosyltransferase 5 [Rosa chinensis]XP_040370652.1 anthocyanidin 3-O-glucosyltransferase 5 [Rosa chinensis]XP_04037065